jgi:hypothetical protein
MLTEDNKCEVYDNRPLICNIDKMRKRLKIPKKKFYAVNIKVCNQFMDEDDLPLNLRIK